MEHIKVNPNLQTSIKSSKTEIIPWYLFPNVLALDAPIVAIIWQHFLAKIFKIELSGIETAALFSTVWFIYLLDHFLDSKNSIYTTQRHVFIEKKRILAITLITLTFTTSVYLTTLLPKLIIVSGFILIILISIYLLLVHSNIINLKTKTNSKELLVGIGFGAGVSLPVINSGLSINIWLPAVTLFSLLCWVNCKLIDNWESNHFRFSKKEIFLLLVLFLCMFFCSKSLVIAVMIALCAFFIVDRFVGSKNKKLSRVLADVCLLSPCLFWDQQ